MWIGLWHIEMFGGLRIRRGEQVILRFRTQKCAELLAYLACSPDRPHPREALAELLWPETEPETGRNRLRMTLTHLRHQLEPPDVPANSVLVADRLHIRLNAAAFTTDVAEFEAAIHTSQSAEGPARREALQKAVALYQGEFLPETYEDWALFEQRRLADVHRSALRQLVVCHEDAGDWERGIDCAHRLIRADPLEEEAHLALMRLYAATGRPQDALKQFEAWERRLREHLDETPSPVAAALARKLREECRLSPPQSPRRRAAPLSPAASPPPSTSAEKESPACTPRIPLTVTRFFGRESELDRLQELLLPATESDPPDAQLVTLTGPGGSGKTRLAIEVARRIAPAMRGAVWFVSFADITDRNLMADTVAEGLELPRSPQRPPLERIIAFLGQQPALLVLDNLEQLVTPLACEAFANRPEDAAAFVSQLLTSVPGLTLVVTSRVALEIVGEREFPVAPLPVPDREQEDVASPLSLVSYSGVALFVDRAQTVQPSFQVTRHNMQAVAALCARLEGIPLAIELAASWARLLTPQQMVSQLERRLDFLVSRQRNVVERHRTLRATIEWSYQMLPPALRQFFTALSIFRGGWTAAAAAAVCLPPTAQRAGSSLEFLERLCLNSLLLAEEVEGEMRYRMLESLREFGEEQLLEQEANELAERHAAYFLAWTQEAEPHLRGPEQGRWLAALEQEHGNLRAALVWYRKREGKAQAGLQLAGALGWFWFVRGYFREGRIQLEAALQREDSPEPTLERAKALSGAGALAWRLGDYSDAHACYTESLTIRRELGDRAGAAAALNGLGIVAHDRGDYETARRSYEESLTIRRELGDRYGVAVALGNLGSFASSQGDYRLAQALQEESLTIRRELGDRQGIAAALNNLGEVTQEMGDLERARRFHTESLAVRRELGDRQGIALSLGNIGTIAYAQRDPEATALLQESIEMFRALGDRQGIAHMILFLGHLALERGEIDEARVCYTESLRLKREAGDKPELLLSLEAFASLRLAQSLPGEAVSLWSAAAHLRESLQVPLPASDRDSQSRALEQARAILGPRAFEDAWRRGQAMTLEQAVEQALEPG